MSESKTVPSASQWHDLPYSTGGLRRTTTTWAAYLPLGLFSYLETAIGPAMPFLRSKLDLDFTMASLHFSAFAAGIITAGVWGIECCIGSVGGLVCGAVLRGWSVVRYWWRLAPVLPAPWQGCS